MKKRLLAIFAAFAVAATMAVGLTACEDNTEDKGDGTHTEQPGGGDNTDPENPDNPGGGDNTDPENPDNPGGGDNTDPENPDNPSGGDNTDPENPDNPGGGDNTDPEKPDDGKDKVKMTEAEWKKTWQDTASIRSYVMVRNGAQGRYRGELHYDNVNEASYSKIQYGESFSESYCEIVDNDLIKYSRYSAYDEWEIDTVSAEAWVDNNELVAFVEQRVAVTGTTVIGTFAELYDYAGYHAETNTYTLNLMNSEPTMFEIQFKDGYLYKISSIDEYEGETYKSELIVTSINSTIVTVPQEVKEEASANGGNQNPDNPGGGDHTEPNIPDNPPHGGQDDPAEEAGYIGTYMFYSLTVDGAEYLAGETFALNGMDIELTSDFMVLVLKEGGVAEVTMSMGGMSETVSCSWEKAAEGVIIYMNGDPALFYTNGLSDCLMMDGFLGLPDAVGTFKKI